MSGKKFYVAVKAAVFNDEGLLIIRRSSQARGDYGTWELPGGRLEFGESPQEALRRELIEEVGISADIGNPIASWTFLKDENTQLVGITFECSPKSYEVFLSEEHIDYAWIGKDGIDNYDFSCGVKEEISQWTWGK